MALIFSSSTVTNLGDSAIASAIGGQTLTITRVAVGSGQLSGSQTPQTQASLVTQQMSLLSPTLINNNNGQILVNAVLDSANVGTAFSLTELGVYGRIGTGAEQLLTYAVAQSPFQFIQFATGTSDAQISVSIPIQVGSVPSQNLTVVLGGQTFTAPVVKGIAPIVVLPVMNVNGVIVEYDVSVTANVQQAINANITLFVFLGAANTYPNFSSVQNALNWLSVYNILPGYTVTIQVAAGIYESATPITVIHPQGSQVQIIGAFTTVNVLSAAFNAGTVTITGATGAFSGWAVGDMVNVDWPSTGSFFQISGTWILTGATSTTISFSSGYASLKTAIGTSSGGQVTRLQTRLNFSAGITGMGVGNGGLGLVKGIGFYGRTSGSIGIAGFTVGNNGIATMDTCGFYGWTDSTPNNSQGVAVISGGNLTVTHTSVGRCSNQFYVYNGFIQATNCWSSVSSSYGFRIIASQAILTTCKSVGCTLTNMQFGNGSYVQLLNCNAVYGFADGIDIINGSDVAHGLGGSAAGNTGTDLVMLNLSLFNGQISGGPALSVGTVNIASGNLSSTGCIYSP